MPCVIEGLVRKNVYVLKNSNSGEIRKKKANGLLLKPYIARKCSIDTVLANLGDVEEHTSYSLI